LAPTGYSQRDRRRHLYIGSAAVTCMKSAAPHPPLLVSGSAPSGYSRPGGPGYAL